MLEDRLLIWKFNRGDRDVVRRIYEKYKDELVTLAAALLNDKTAAEDAVHDAFVGFIRSAERIGLLRNLKGYLATCVVNNARNRNKAKHRHHSVGLDEAEPVSAKTRGPDGSAIFGEELHRLNLALGQLRYEQREVIILRLYSGVRFKAIAKSQGVSINTVQGRYRYGLGKLRSLLNGEVKNETSR